MKKTNATKLKNMLRDMGFEILYKYNDAVKAFSSEQGMQIRISSAHEQKIIEIEMTMVRSNVDSIQYRCYVDEDTFMLTASAGLKCLVDIMHQSRDMFTKLGYLDDRISQL